MLSRLLFRNAVVQALLEPESDGSYPTFAGPNVFDSRIYPLELDDQRDEVPVAAVYTETSKFSGKPRDEQALISNTTMEVNLCIDIAVAENTTVVDEKTQAQTQTLQLVQTDAELEAILDIFEAQILWTLQNPSKKWSRVFGNLCMGIISYESKREAEGGKNNRMAFREITLGCLICPDPVPRIIPAGVKKPQMMVCKTIPKTGTYLDDMLEQMGLSVINGSLNLSTAIGIMQATFGAGGSILMPALKRIGMLATLPDEASPDGKIAVAQSVVELGSPG
jgi:hypothetical protein